MKALRIDSFQRRACPAAARGIRDRRARRRAVLAIWFVALAGCGTVTFKTGASPGETSAAEQACRSAHPDQTGFVECMRQRGFFVSGPKAPTAPTPVEPAAPAESVEPAVPADSARPAAPPEPPAALDAAEPQAGGLAPAATASDDAASAPPVAADPLPRVHVSSWWKLGGNPADLDRAIDACVANLGPGDRPESGATVVTVAMQACLRDAGWYSLEAPRAED